VSAAHPIDRNRIYLYGYQGGGTYALALALIDSRYFAAAATNTGVFEPQDFGLFNFASRKMPIGIWVGRPDMSLPKRRQLIRSTRYEFHAHGYPVSFSIAANYDKPGAWPPWDDVELEAWVFLRDSSLS
jgi:predicted peptidase